MTDNEEMRRDLARAKKEAEMWRKIARLAFTMHPNCLEGCRRGMLCTCGYMLYTSYLAALEQGTV